MTYRQLLYKAQRLINNNEITLGEYDEMTNPLEEEVRKQGHNCNDDYAECDQFICSECGIELQDWCRVERDEEGSPIGCYQYEFKFCPNCGAVMKGEKNG